MFISVSGWVGRGPSALFCPGAYNAAKTALPRDPYTCQWRSRRSIWELCGMITEGVKRFGSIHVRTMLLYNVSTSNELWKDIGIYYILSSNKGIFVWPIWPEVNCPYFYTPGKNRYWITTRSFPYRGSYWHGPIWASTSSQANMGVSFLDVGSM